MVEADADKAEQAAAWLKAAMEEGMRDVLDPAPVAVEVATAQTWGG